MADKDPEKIINSLIGSEVDIPYHKGVRGKITDEEGDTYGVEYTGPNGITRKDRFYKNEFKSPLELSNALVEDSDVPAVSPKERVAPGGLIGEFERAGHKVFDVTDNSFKVDGTPFRIVANNSLGFDVYYRDKKVANDIGNHKDFIALMEKIIKNGGIE